MKSTTIEDVSEILDTFDLEEIRTLISTQVQFKEGSKSDYFKPIYIKYKQVIDSNSTEEMKEKAEDRFNSVCKIFIEEICNRYRLSIDEIWVDDNIDQLPALVVALYSFFVKDLSANLQEVCSGYIRSNQKAIYNVFEERKNKKDAHTLVNKNNYPLELAVIISNIYDVSTWVIKQLSEEEYVKYLNSDYASLRIVDSLMKDGILSGEFMQTIEEIYEDCVGLKAEICLNIISSYREEF